MIGKHGKLIFSAALCGLLFGAGLAIADVTDPAKILAFFDFFGAWDPSLAFTLGGALTIAAITFGPARRRSAGSAGETPILGERYDVPRFAAIDRQLIGGAALFGVGWGLVGFCVGPAIAALAFGNVKTVVFVAAMVVGLWLGKTMKSRASTGDPAAAN